MCDFSRRDGKDEASEIRVGGERGLFGIFSSEEEEMRRMTNDGCTVSIPSNSSRTHAAMDNER